MKTEKEIHDLINELIKMRNEHLEGARKEAEIGNYKRAYEISQTAEFFNTKIRTIYDILS